MEMEAPFDGLLVSFTSCTSSSTNISSTNSNVCVVVNFSSQVIFIFLLNPDEKPFFLITQFHLICNSACGNIKIFIKW